MSKEDKNEKETDNGTVFGSYPSDSDMCNQLTAILIHGIHFLYEG
jgi:hypothetical protein